LKQEVASTSSSYKPPHVLVASQNERTLRFPVKLLVGNQIVETSALIDSGATGNFLDIGLLSLANFPLQRLPKPIQAYNVDGSTNRKGTILWKTKIPVLPFQKTNSLELMIVSLGQRQIILGMPWLKTRNPRIDWQANMLSFPSSPTTETDDHMTPQ
jgi:predicted aspartyl protease